jgi:hypothetical protein
LSFLDGRTGGRTAGRAAGDHRIVGVGRATWTGILASCTTGSSAHARIESLNTRSALSQLPWNASRSISLARRWIERGASLGTHSTEKRRRDGWGVSPAGISTSRALWLSSSGMLCGGKHISRSNHQRHYSGCHTHLKEMADFRPSSRLWNRSTIVSDQLPDLRCGVELDDTHPRGSARLSTHSLRLLLLDRTFGGHTVLRVAAISILAGHKAFGFINQPFPTVA